MHGLAAALDLEDAMIETGHLSDDEVSSALNAADLAALPYLLILGAICLVSTILALADPLAAADVFGWM